MTSQRPGAPEGLIVSPGFIDLQINGGSGTDLATDPSTIWELGRHLPRHGVTSMRGLTHGKALSARVPG